MTHPPRKLAFVIAATDHGTMIVSRFDEHRLADNLGFGVGFQLLDTASYDQSDVALLLTVLDLRRRYHGDGSWPSIAAPISESKRWNGPST
jgi:hypothetical protein